MELSVDDVQRMLGAKELVIYDLARKLDAKDKEITSLRKELSSLRGEGNGKDSKETSRPGPSK